jgi:hypothetical protein
VLFIGTQFSNLYTAVDTPAMGRVIMTEPTTLRLVLSIANELVLELDHLDIKSAHLNAELPEIERVYCSPPAGFKVPRG